MGETLDQFRKMRGHHAQRIDNGEAHRSRTISACEAGIHQAGTPKAGIFGWPAFGRPLRCRERNGQFAALRQFEARDLDAFQADRVFARAQRQIVGHAHGRNNESEIGRKLFADAADAAQQR